ncbi:MAG: TraB/GumN family protein [Bacteroidota bacterium]
MTLKLWISVLTLIVILPLSISAQAEEIDTSRSNYALLWEISGNGLAAPSYLFGSMHVRYNAVFEFPDSLYTCLQTCDAIANEVHLDSAMQRFYEVYYGREELEVDSSYIKLTAQKSAKTDSLDQLYELDHPAEDFDIRDFFKGLVRLDDIEERGFQRTMLDAHLVEKARALGLRQYGLEDMDEHMYEPEYRATISPTPLKSFLFGNNFNTLLDIYYQGDIAAVEKFMRASPGAGSQFALIPRNYIMCNSMETIMRDKEERLFTVVGAAHLPGSEGVIQILKDRGYTLRKVEATFTGLRDSFQIEEKARIWQKKTAADQTYTYALPWSFEYQQIDGSSQSFYASDIGQGLNYLVMKTALLPDQYEGFDKWFFEEDGYEIEEKEEIVHQGIEGHSYLMKRPGFEPEHYLGYTFIADQELYYLQIGSYKKEELSSNPNVDQLLEQFEVIQFNNGKWVSVVDTLGGFRVRLPSNYNYTRSYRNDTYDYAKAEDYPLHIYRAGFNEEKASVWVHYYDLKTGTTPISPTTRLNEAKAELTEQYGLEFEVINRKNRNGITEWELESDYPSLNIKVKIKLIVRGNRLYQISRLDTPGGKLTKKFWPSFQLLPLSASPLVTSELLADGQVSCQLPANYTVRKDNFIPMLDLPTERYLIDAQDEAAAANYQLEINRLPTLFGTPDTTKVLDYLLDGFVLEEDSVHHKERVLIQGQYPGIELYVQNSSYELDQLIQVYVADNYWIKKKVYADSAYLFSTNVNRFFNGDHWQKDTTRNSSLVDRTAQIINAFSSTDSMTVESAFKAFKTELNITKDNVADFADLLLDNHWEEIHQDPDKLRAAILNGIRQNSDNPNEVLALLFGRAKENTALKNAILSHLSTGLGDDTKLKSQYFSLLQSDELVSANADDFLFAPYQFDLALFLEDWSYFESLLVARQEPLFVWKKAAQILQADSLNQAPILAAEQQFFTRALERMQGDSLSASELAIVLDLLMELPSNINMNEQVNQLFEEQEITPKTVLRAEFLLSKGVKLPKRSIKEIVSKRELRVDLIRMLNQHDQLQLLPKNSYDQLEIAMTLFKEKLKVEELGEISDISFLDTQKVLHEGEPQLVYVFSFKLEEEENLLGIAGFFSTNRKEKTFADNQWVNYTLYSIPSRRRFNKVNQLVKEMSYSSFE